MSFLENVTIGQVLLAMLFVTTAIQTYTNLKGTWRKWLHSEMDEVKDSINKVHHEVTPNGGKSVADAVNRIEKTVARVDKKQNVLAARVKKLENPSV